MNRPSRGFDVERRDRRPWRNLRETSYDIIDEPRHRPEHPAGQDHAESRAAHPQTANDGGRGAGELFTSEAKDLRRRDVAFSPSAIDEGAEGPNRLPAQAP